MHPYKEFPARQFWHQAVSGTPWADVLRHERGKFTITADHSVASAGSCFAQRISRLIIDSGLDYTFYEKPHPLLSAAAAAAQGYGTFSCRFGNIYTTRQLLQLVKEALGITPPTVAVEQNSAGLHVDLLRPNIHSGFESLEEAIADRSYHLKCVARMLAECDVFIFTLGLTETWVDTTTGTVFGSHPSVITKRATSRTLQAHNLDYIECYNDLVEVMNLLRGINASIKIIFTVSPVALAATHQPQHVLVATAHSKAVLRAVAGKFAAVLPHVDYFPSFEVFNLAQSFGQFLSEDLRDVSPRGVQVAMDNFRQMFLEPARPVALNSTAAAPASAPVVERGIPDASSAGCDEILNAFFSRSKAA